MVQKVTAFVDAIKALLTQELPPDPPLASVLSHARSLLPARQKIISNIGRTTLPVTARFQSAIGLACAPKVRPLLHTIIDIEPFCSWRQNPEYSATDVGDHFMKSYGYFQVIGPGGLIDSSQLAVGVLLLGERVRYPEHAHPAIEIYSPICGEALWSQKGIKPTLRLSGELIYHSANEVHAMETVDQSMIAVYIWIGDVFTPAHLTPNSIN